MAKNKRCIQWRICNCKFGEANIQAHKIFLDIRVINIKTCSKYTNRQKHAIITCCFLCIFIMGNLVVCKIRIFFICLSSKCYVINFTYRKNLKGILLKFSKTVALLVKFSKIYGSVFFFLVGGNCIYHCL